jgi:hypothetical protein
VVLNASASPGAQRQKDKYAAGAGKKAKADLAKKAEAALLAFQSKLTKVEGGGDKDDEGDEEEEKGYVRLRLYSKAACVACIG